MSKSKQVNNNALFSKQLSILVYAVLRDLDAENPSESMFDPIIHQSFDNLTASADNVQRDTRERFVVPLDTRGIVVSVIKGAIEETCRAQLRIEAPIQAIVGEIDTLLGEESFVVFMSKFTEASRGFFPQTLAAYRDASSVVSVGVINQLRPAVASRILGDNIATIIFDFLKALAWRFAVNFWQTKKIQNGVETLSLLHGCGMKSCVVSELRAQANDRRAAKSGSAKPKSAAKQKSVAKPPTIEATPAEFSETLAASAPAQTAPVSAPAPSTPVDMDLSNETSLSTLLDTLAF